METSCDNAKKGEEENIKYPFCGIAPNLIDKFLVFGYEQKAIDYLLKFGNPEKDQKFKTRFDFYEFEERPSIINEISNDYCKDLLDNDLLLELIFPKFPVMYFLDKQYINTKKELDEELLTSNYSIIFSINPQDNYGSKKSYNGLGYIFYNVLEGKNAEDINGILYVPVAYVILSEYPYFYHFNEICKNIYIQMKKETDEIPIEIILYNTVKFAPSPINNSINLLFGAQIGFRQDKDMSVESLLSSLNSNIRKEKGIPSMFFNQLSGYPLMDINLSFIFNLIPPEIIVEVFIFSFLEHDIIFYSSRPEILNMVMYVFANLNYPFNDSIYYWHLLSVSHESFMEGSSTFVGKTSSTMTGILSEYNSSFLTTKKIREHFVLDIDNKNFFFLFQEETEEVKNTMDLYQYIKSCASDVEESSNEGKKIDQETKVKNYYNDGIQLYEVIRNLMEELQRRAKKVTSTNYNETNEKPTFLTMYEDESEIECMKSNLRLQKAFFTFITQIMQNFVSILSIVEEKQNDRTYSESRIPSIVIDIKKEEIDKEEETKRKLAKKAARIFKDKFRDSSKYSSFVVNFCQYHETIDIYKIPYTFINEFVYYSHVAVKNNLSEVDVFKLIDQFYGIRKMIDFEEIIREKEIENLKEEDERKKEKKKDNKKKKKDQSILENEKSIQNDIDILTSKKIDYDIENIYLFWFDQFSEYYQKYLRTNINREQEDDREIFIRVKSTNKRYKKYKRNGFFLSNKLLNIYNNYLNDNFVDILETFHLKKYEKLDKNKINDKDKKRICQKEDYFFLLKLKDKKIKYEKKEKNLILFGDYRFVEITDVIESHFILERCFSSYGLIKFSLLNVLAVTRDFHSPNVSDIDVITTMCDFCEKTKSLVRKYMNLYLNIFQKKMKDGKKKEIESCSNIVTSYFTKTNMIPTQETTKTINEIKETEKNENGKKESSVYHDEVKEKNFETLVKNKGIFMNTKKKNDDVVKIIKTLETIFSGKYKPKSTFFCIEKEFDTLFHQLYNKKDKEYSDKFIPKTPLSLYASTIKILNEYMKEYKNNEDINLYKELGRDILSLYYYFKLPDIKLKWIEHYKIEDKRTNTIKGSDKQIKKGKDTKDLIKNPDEKDMGEEYDRILKKLIAILYDLFDNVREKIKKSN